MKKYTLVFLIATALTGLIGFAGLTFYGVIAVRVLFLIFADLLIVSVISHIICSDTSSMRLKRVKK
jgi:uncharacterized membrane protein YtjA (UPF0391 family)